MPITRPTPRVGTVDWLFTKSGNLAEEKVVEVNPRNGNFMVRIDWTHPPTPGDLAQFELWERTLSPTRFWKPRKVL